MHYKTNSYNSELGKQISSVYRKRKPLLHEVIKREEWNNKLKF